MSFSSSETPRQGNDKYSTTPGGDKHSERDESAEGSEGNGATTASNHSRTKAAARLIRNRRDHQRSTGPPRPPETDSTLSVASDTTEEVTHVRNAKKQPDDVSAPEKAPEKPPINKSTASQVAVRSFRRLRANRQRVPGGAAAKLFGKSQEAEPEPVNDDNDEPAEVLPPSDELDRIRQEAVAEFTKGPKANRRYHASEENVPGIERTPSEASLPSILNKAEIFHENATAAVLSLLNPPTHARDARDTMSLASKQSFTNEPVPRESSSNVFLPPTKSDDDASSTAARKGTSPHAKTSELTASGKIQLQQPLLSKKAEKKLDQIAKQMINPNKTLADLMSAIASPADGVFSRGYMVRRKNACGALQVLTANNVHRVKICWTKGVLPSITSVLEDGANLDDESVFPDQGTRREYLDARKRAISALMNLSMPPDNRLAVFHSPRLVSALIRVINQDSEESRKGCCAVLAQLAKTKENRLLLAQVPGLIEAATGVIEPPKPEVPEHESLHKENMESTSSSDASTGAADVFSSYLSDDEIGQKPSIEVVSKKHTEEEDPIAASRLYDSDPNTHLHGARQNIFAFLGHLLKEKDNAYYLARHKYLMTTLVAVSKLHDSASHEHAVRLLAHLTRHRGNSKELVFKLRIVVPAIVKATVSMNDEARKHACFALQNLSQDKPCRQELAVTKDLLTALCVRIRQAANAEERLSAIHALKNLTDEPANLIPMTNTPECFATLMQIAHASDDSVTEMMQYLGCDALATLSHWFRSIATSGQRIDTMKRGHKPSKDLFVPTLKIVTWQRWQ